jgi:hypothetical protein
MLRSLFDRSIPRSCNLATSSVVEVLLPSASKGAAYTFTPEPGMFTDTGTTLYDVLEFPEKLAHSRIEVPLYLISPLRWSEKRIFSYRMYPSWTRSPPLRTAFRYSVRVLKLPN